MSEGVEGSGNGQNKDIKKPSLISQLIPWAVAAAILAYVFTSLSSNVVDERHALSGREWTELDSRGIKPGSIKVRSKDRHSIYCPEDRAEDGAGGCKAPDFEVRPESGDYPAALRRTEGSRIPDGSIVSIDYVKSLRPGEIWDVVRRADLALFLPVMALHCMIFFMVDVISFGIPYRSFNTPDITWREVMECRGAPYLFQIVLAPLAEVMFPLYMKRVKNAPVADVVSSNIWTIFLDMAALFTAVTPAVIYNLYVDKVASAIGPGWLAACLLFWAVFFFNLAFWHSPLRVKAAAWVASGRDGTEDKTGARRMAGEMMQLLRTFSLARWRHYLPVYGSRLLLLLSSLASSYAALRAMGVSPPLPLALISFPIIVLSVFQPIGVGGYGGPQLIAWFLLTEVGGSGTADQVIAYSFLWSTGFLAGRAVIGLVFIRGFWKRIKKR